MLEIINAIGVVIYFCCGWSFTSMILSKLGIVTISTWSDWFFARFVAALLLGAIGTPYYIIRLILSFFAGSADSGNKTDDSDNQ